jgi:hypothetical protein
MTKATEVEQPTEQSPNFTLTFRRTHPKNRCSYGVAGVPGLAVFDVSLFAGKKPPKAIVLDVALATGKPVKGKK